MAFGIRLFSLAIHLFQCACVLTNLYVLLNRSDTIHYLRIYHLGVGVLMVSSGILQIRFMFKAHRVPFTRLAQPCSIPRHTTVSAMVLTAGIVLGYAYFIVFEAAFSNCDKLIDAQDSAEQLEDTGANLLMIFFCIISLVYIWQRSFFGPLHNCGDKLMRKWVNSVLAIVWVQIVVFKGYLSYQELCQRKELSGYWCPVIKRPYECDPERLKGTQKIWYYLHKGLLNSTIISCASEFFPVLLVAHWIACGGGREGPKEQSSLEEQSESQQAIATAGCNECPASVSPTLTGLFISMAFLSVFAVSVNWFVDFYVSMQFDAMHERRSMLDDYADFGASFAHLLLFSSFWQWTRRKIPPQRWDLSQKSKSRGDLVLILGSVTFMSLKLALQLMELQFQRADGFLFWNEALFQSCSLIMIQASQWVQVLCLRFVLCFHERDLLSMRHFLPLLAAAAIAVNAVDFGTTFFETNTIKYQLSLPENHFSQNTLLSMILTQTIYPADYLFCFTAAGCWMDVLLRYSEIGLFQLGATEKHEKLQELEGMGWENVGGQRASVAEICLSMSSENMTQIVVPSAVADGNRLFVKL